jgi:hypothetical protein
MDPFTVEVLDEGSNELLETTGSQWVRRPAWNRFLAFSNNLVVERRGFSFLMDSIVILVIELDSSRAISTRSSGLILSNRWIRRDGGALYSKLLSQPSPQAEKNHGS